MIRIEQLEAEILNINDIPKGMDYETIEFEKQKEIEFVLDEEKFDLHQRIAQLESEILEIKSKLI